MSQLRELATPFPAKLVKAPPKGKFGSYVSHSTVNERALSIVGPFSFEVTEVLRGPTPEIVTNKGKPNEKVWPARDAVVGCLAKLSVDIDGAHVVVVEVGDVEGAAAQDDGANLKEASSDAFKRCWMRLGLGLHLWSGDDYFLDKQLDANAKAYFNKLRRQKAVDTETGEVGYTAVLLGEPFEQEITYAPDDPERPFEDTE